MSTYTFGMVEEAAAALMSPEEVRGVLWRFAQEVAVSDVPPALAKVARQAVEALDAADPSEPVAPEIASIARIISALTDEESRNQ